MMLSKDLREQLNGELTTIENRAGIIGLCSMLGSGDLYIMFRDSAWCDVAGPLWVNLEGPDQHGHFSFRALNTVYVPEETNYAMLCKVDKRTTHRAWSRLLPKRWKRLGETTETKVIQLSMWSIDRAGRLLDVKVTEP